MHVLELQVLEVGERLILTGQERQGEVGSPLSTQEEVHLPREQVRRLSAEMHACLPLQHQARGNRSRLERLGLQLIDQLIGQRTKSLLRTTTASHLLLKLPPTLLFIPWELLHDGERFLCLRFAMGRTVALEDALPTVPMRTLLPPYRLLIVSDPRGDLPDADQEGTDLLQSLRSRLPVLQVNFLSGSVSHQQVVEELRAFDLVHYAGHAAAAQSGQPAGWLLEDGIFSAADVLRMRGARSFPALIFANACLSGARGMGEDALPGAFLSAGVRHYLGTVSDVTDASSRRVAEAFYQQLFKGESVGEAVRQARRQVADESSTAGLVWAGYLLYGDPTARYLQTPLPVAEPPGPSTPWTQEENQLTPVEIPPRPASPSAPVLVPSPSLQVPAGRRKGLAAALGGLAAALGGLAAALGGLAAALGGLAALLGLAGHLAVPDLLWEGTIQHFFTPQGSFRTPITLLSIDPNDRGSPRELYAELLEHLHQRGVLPRLVAFDTWLTGEEKPGDARLIAAVARSLERFPLIFGLEPRADDDHLLPPPRWFLAGLEEVLLAEGKAVCQGNLDLSEKGATSSENNVKGCALEYAQMRMRERLFWGNVVVSRPPWALETFALRVPLLSPTLEADGGLRYQGPHFSVLVAYPERGWGDPAAATLHTGDAAAVARYDLRGMLPVVWRGRASWQDGPAFPAYPLRQVLSAWQRLEGGPDPSDLSHKRILVGLAAPQVHGQEQDFYSTPIGGMFGVEVLANVSESLVQRTVPQPVRRYELVLGATALLGLAGFWFGRRWSSFWIQSAALALGLTLIGMSSVLLRLAWYWPPTAPVLAFSMGILLGRWQGRFAPAPSPEEI